MLSNYVRFKHLDENRYLAYEHIFEEEIILDAEAVRFVRKLDGKTDPYSIGGYSASEVDELLEELEYREMLRHSRVLVKWIGTIYYTVFIPHIKKTGRIVSLILNRLLLVSWLPVLVMGFITYVKAGDFEEFDFLEFWLGIIPGVIAGTVFHEFGHAIAGLGYGGTVYEVGISITNFLPSAYTMIKTENIKNPLRRIQIDAAGVEMNMLLAGVFMFMAALFPELGNLLLSSAIVNIADALFNLVFIADLDGAHIIGTILGDMQFVQKSRRLVFSRKARKKMRKKGINGEAAIAVSYILAVMQLALPAVYLLSVLEMMKL